MVSNSSCVPAVLTKFTIIATVMASRGVPYIEIIIGIIASLIYRMLRSF